MSAFSSRKWFEAHHAGMTAFACIGVIGELLDRRAVAPWWRRWFLTRQIRRLEARRDAAMAAAWRDPWAS